MKSICCFLMCGLLAIGATATYDVSKCYPFWNNTFEVGATVIGIFAFISFVLGIAFADIDEPKVEEKEEETDA